MIPRSGKVMGQFARFSSKSRMQYAIKNENSSNKSTSLHKQLKDDASSKNYSFIPYASPSQHKPSSVTSSRSTQSSSVGSSRSTQSSSVVVQPATNPFNTTSTTNTMTKEEEKLLLKKERERQAIARTENNARFKEYLLRLPPLSYPSHYKVDCVSTLDETNKKLAQLLKNNEEKVFGVDLEWPPCFVKGQAENKVTLVQICSADSILLIQVARIQGGFPPQLRQFFEDKTILKSGVNIGADGLKLHRDFGFITNGLLELRDLAEMTKSPKLEFSHLRSLRALTGLFLEQNMAKGKVRLSNWAVSKLSPLQIKYAALDAYASYQLYVVLNALKDTNKSIHIRHLVNEDVPEANQVKKTKNGQQQKPASKQQIGHLSGPSSTVTIVKKKQ